ncbi:PP2C family protein-serine/threonine phosphatase [Nocardioides campestrisoli]|uniref:PP2C family protein-serine/threonine phosphatase n=1 Tax=Nocardioides campestrisoli TaxID=2736757 RepID=UPI0015E6447D|nr:PP2C family protein-serine/threonine phosphatase [Nocardioides campestrisoli]
MAEANSVLSASARRVRQHYHRAVRTGMSEQLVLLVVVTLLMAAAIVGVPDYAPLILMVLPMAVASLVLGPRQLPWFIVFVLLTLAVTVTQQPDITVRVAVTVAVLFVLGFIVLLASFRRSTLGVAGVMGESMLVDLRDRILKQGAIPTLPARWNVAWELRSAGGTAFAGDFVVASRSRDRLELAVVDVSGKGEDAGTRALLLSGAFGGLLGAMSPAQFLPAANDYLLRQAWEEGFATAIHLSLDLATGHFELRSAGHPPAAVHDAGTGRWGVVVADGPLLGLIEDATYPSTAGVMRPGDAMLLYTDGLVEERGRDISLGIDRMLGQAERILRGDFEDGAARLIDALGSPDDDRALLMVHRRP